MKKLGDRKDGKLLRNLDGMHFIVPLLYPNRCDNEAYNLFYSDATKLNEYLDKYNAAHEGARLSPFIVAVAAMIKTFYLRPKMNRFIANRKIFQRNDITASFVIKIDFHDDGAENLAFIHTTPESTLDDIFAETQKQISEARAGKVDTSSDAMDTFAKMPGFISRTLVRFICFLDKHGWVPNFLIDTDPYYSSMLFSYLGSIRLPASYHHLTNWGTLSCLVTVGEKKVRPFYDRKGNLEMKDSMEYGITIDERIADGYYFAKSIRLFLKLMENPELLEQPFSTEVTI